MDKEKNCLKNMSQLAEFVMEHYGDDPDRLALQKEKWPGIDMAAVVSTLVSRRKLAGKAPVWAAAKGLVLPRTLSAEQCSGEMAARHKARAIRTFLEERPDENATELPDGSFMSKQEGNAVRQNAETRMRRWHIADLTGGLGVDCLEFSRVAEAVLYNEMLPELAAAAEHNFGVLGAKNVEICSQEATPATLGRDGGELYKRLEKFHPDVIFLDPARRDSCGKKVFLLEDCSPDILKIKDLLLDIVPVLVVKLSPMADISMVLERLGKECRELQIIESGGECKELLVLMRRDTAIEHAESRTLNAEGQDVLESDKKEGNEAVQKQGMRDSCLIKVYNLDTEKAGNETNNSPVFEFRYGEENCCTGLQFAESEEIVPGALLFEPGKALMKAGCFKLIGKWLDAPALGRDTHYYILGNNYMTTDGNPPAPYEDEYRNQEAQRNKGRNAEEHNDKEKNYAIKASVARAGKLFRILDVTEMSRKALKEFGKRHPEAEVTARNVKMTSEELRKRLGCKSSDRYHTFALHADKTGENLLFFTERV